MKNKLELAQIVKQFGKELTIKESLSPIQNKALFNIMLCRTAYLGGHEEVCDHCGEIRYSYNSCGDRHCPKCQSTKQALWVEHLQETTLPVKHFHIIFTVPHCLNDICLWNSSMFYKHLFSAVWRTLHSFGYTHFGSETGAIAILHTWGQNLSLHPHIHCIVPAVGFSLNGKWKHIGKSEKYLYPVHELSETFKGKFLDSMKRELNKSDVHPNFKSHIQKAYATKWIVFSEYSLAKAEHVIKYLGQYTHRVAISNQRIKNISKTHVTFIAKDYRDNGSAKLLTLDGVEFLRRFCLHVLPKQFVKIRRYGIYNHTTKKNLELFPTSENKSDNNKTHEPIKKETAIETVKRLSGIDLCQCPKCKKGAMIVVKELPRIRSPNTNIPVLLLSLMQ